MSLSTLHILRSLIFQGLYHGGKFVSPKENTLTVLCYHSFSNKNEYSVPIEKFIKQIEALGSIVGFVALDKVLEVLNGKELEKPSVVITVDDGYKDILQLLPVSKKYNIPVTVFILSDPEKANRKELSHSGELLSENDIVELSKAGWTIGSHGATHANLRELSAAELKKEIIDSKQKLEKVIGKKIDYFAYPRGLFSTEAIRMVKEGGYKAAFSVRPGLVEKNTNRWIMPRTVINRYDNVEKTPTAYTQGTGVFGKLRDKLVSGK